VYELLQEMGINIILSSDIKRTIQNLRMEYKKKGGNVLTKPVGDIAERGIMEDPC